MARKGRASSAQKLLGHIDALREKLAEKAPLALRTFDAEHVHDARVATRRLSAALDLLAPVLGKSDRKPLAKGLSRLRHRLGRLRDADVLLARLAEIGPAVRQPVAADWMQVRLEKSHRKLKEQCLKKSPPQRALRQVENWAAVRSQIEEADEAIDCLIAESLHLQTDALEEQAKELVWRVNAAEGTPAGSQHPHEVRIAAKNLRYTVEMAEACRRPLGTAAMRLFKKMQDQLGAWHDWVVLVERILSEMIDEELAQAATAAEAAIELARLCLRRSAKDLQAFARTWQQRGPALMATIRARFPLTNLESALPAPAIPTESETDPGLPDLIESEALEAAPPASPPDA